MKRYRIASGVRAWTESTSDWCVEHVRGHLPRLVKALRDGAARSTLDLAGLVKGSDLEVAFLAAAESGSPWALPRNVVFPPSPFPLTAHFIGGGQRTRIRLDDREAWAAVASLFLGVEGEWSSQAEAFAATLSGAGHIEGAEPAGRRDRAPGVYRLQHACALVVGKEAQVLIDPVHFVDHADSIRPDDIGVVDAILLTHGHGDHVCPLSLAHYPRQTPILLYPILGGSILCGEMDTILKAAGFTDVRVLECGATATFGDLRVTARRYFGEQPWLAHPPPHPRLRTSGLTWLVEANGRCLWFLADGGSEYGGSMLEEAAEIRATFGRVDLIAANLREFHWKPGQIDGSGRTLFCYPTDVLFDPHAWPDHQLMTLGVRGAADVAKAAGAECLAPYAHWFHRPSEPIILDDGKNEQELVREVRQVTRGALNAIDWRIGDALTFEAGSRATLGSGAFKS